MIQSFQVKILFYNSLSAAPYLRAGSIADIDTPTALNISRLYDTLHQLVARLQLRQRPIARLEVAIKFLNTYARSSGALTSTQLFPAV